MLRLSLIHAIAEGGGWSGKGTALPPLPPLRTGGESFPSSGSSRFKAPRARRFNPGFVAMDAKGVGVAPREFRLGGIIRLAWISFSPQAGVER